MSKQKANKKKKTIHKILTAVAVVLAVVVVAAAVIWFSLPKEMRNMVTMMLLPGESYDSYEVYQVIDRNDEAIAPTAFEPAAAENSQGDDNFNVAAVTQMVLNEDSGMLKKGNVQTVGVEDYTGWYVIADEGAGDEYPFGPSPLSYYTSGAAANLHTQIMKAAEIQGVELDSVKVEVLNKFRWDNMTSEDGAGFLDWTNTSIIIESSESEETVQKVIDIALNAWTVGEALRNETLIEPNLVINGDNWDNYRAEPGTTNSVDSFDGDFQLTSVTDIPRVPEYSVPTQNEYEGMSFSFDAITNMEFEIFAIAESAENSDRPYLTVVTLSTPSNETWQIYADEFMGEGDVPIAPTSMEYFTLGTALCLTSQTTLVSTMMDLNFTEYRVENQTDYRQEDVNTAEIAGYTDTVHSYILIESDESQERIETFFNKSLSLCFAGEGLKNATEMNTSVYLNGEELK